MMNYFQPDAYKIEYTSNDHDHITSGQFIDNITKLNIGIDKLRVFAFAIDLRSVLAFGLPFILYFLTLAPTVYNLDSAELTTASYTGGIVRATGYPLYLTIGYFWSKLPIADVGFRMNLLSAFCGALTIMLADRILRRWQVSLIAAFGSLGLLATGTFFWGLSLIAEVYTLHTAIMVALILALIRWGEKPSPDRFALVGLLTGLGLSHHMATLLLIPGSVFYILATDLRRAIAIKSLIFGFSGLFIGLGFYLYIPIRYLADPAFNYAGLYDQNLNFNAVNLMTLDGLIWLITGRVFTGQMLAYQGQFLWKEILDFTKLLTQAFFVFGIIPGIFGSVMLIKRNWRQAGMLLLMFVFSAGFYIDYRVVDKDTMFLPAFVIWALWLGLGYHVLFSWLKLNITEARLPHWGWVIARGIVILVVITALIWNWGIADLSKDRSARERGERILEIAGENALIFGWWDSVPVVQYLQLVEGQRSDVIAINRFLIPYENMVEAIKTEIGKRPIYIDSTTKEISSFATPKLRGSFYELVPTN